MTVGETLAEARHQAGLSVDELSERTRIRETVLRSIERDDYEACGGDLYVRGYLRAIAGAVGIDAQPLIQEYDKGRAAASTTTFGAIGAFGADPAATRFDLQPVPEDPEDPAVTRFDLPPVVEDLMAAGYSLPQEGNAAHARQAAPDNRAARADAGSAGAAGGAGAASARPRGSGRGLLAGVAAVVVLGLAGAVGVHLASSSTTSRNTAATSVPRSATPSASPAKTVPSKSAKTATPARLPVRSLPIAAAEAFGPDGLSDGDNQDSARYAIAGDAPLPWSTQWYATPKFGMLKRGTGLLLDLGRRVTITGVRLDLAGYRGANLQLRVGDTTNPGDFRVAATVTDTGGVVRLTLPRQASARYLLVWFTLLPPNGSGQYQESVSRVHVNGRDS